MGQLTKQEASREWPVVDRLGRPAGLEDICHGQQIFLLCAGPSLKTLDLSQLNQRGIVTFGLNQVPTLHRTTYWTFGDKPSKFHDVIWCDPGIIKFVPSAKMNGGRNNEIRTKVGPQEFENTGKFPRDFPSVFGIDRNSKFKLDEWLWEDQINWGHSKKHGDGQPTILNTMLQSLRLCYYLGFRTVYLLGVDFRMEADRYAFPETHKPGAVGSNQNAYNTLRFYLRALKKWFDAASFRVINCNPESELDVFETVAYEEAIRRAIAASGIPAEIDTVGWYDGFPEPEDDE
jgi:hypothetical protein